MKVGTNIVTISSIFLLLVCDGVADLFQCTLCEPDTFCFQDVEQNCPTHSISFFGADNITDCVCKAGYYRNNHECILCPIDHFCPGDQTVHFCPANAISLAGAVNISMCLCDKGFAQQDQAVCVSCSEGKYKDFVGNHLCVACPSDTYNIHQQSIHVDECLFCPALTISSTGSSNVNQCVATIGAFAETNIPLTAQLCPPTTYQDEINQTTCKQCDTETYQSVYGATSNTACTACPEYSQIVNGPADEQSDCICNHGYTGPDGGFCTSCSAGTYKSILGSSECLITPVNTFSLSGSTTWHNCPANSSSEIASISIKNCTCHAGFSLQVLNLDPYEVKCKPCEEGLYKHIDGNFNCYECEAGTFASGLGNTVCSLCAANEYSHAKSNECISCGQYQYSLPGSANEESCGCIAGYEHVTNSCQSCTLGKHRQQNQTHNQVNRSYERCEFCEEGKYTLNTGSTSASDCLVCASNKYVDENWNCVDCFDFSTSTHQSHGYESCICNAGYTSGGAGVCEACAEGKYKSLQGGQECTTCPIGKYGTGGEGSIDEESQCIACPSNTYGSIDESSNLAVCVQCNSNSVSVAGSTSVDSCVCDVGYSEFNQNCVPCVGSYFKATIGNDACVPCDLQLFTNVTGATSCLNCPANSERLSLDSTLSIESCVCKPGFTGNNGENCIQCNAGTFKTIYGSSSCVGCGDYAYFQEVDSTNVNYCKACPEHSTSLTGLAFGIAECTCQEGFYRFDNVTCVQCFNNFYCPDEHHMYECPANTQSASGSHTISQCTCNAGYYGQTWNFAATQSEVVYSNCTLCPVNSYCVGGAVNPIACMNDATTQGKLGSKNKTSCICNPGFYESMENSLVPYCKLCPRDSYCHLDSVWSCPPNSSASTQSTSVEDCHCNAGLKLNIETQTCVSCDQNQVCFADGTVQVCAQNATNNNQHCLCQAGTYCNGGDGGDGDSNSNSSCLHDKICSLCPEDTYCAMNKMIECNLNEVSAAGSIISSQCRCAEGFYRVSGECIQCLDNYFCTNEQKYAIATYDPNIITTSQIYGNDTIFVTSSSYHGAGAASIFDTVCKPGMFRTSTMDLCKSCPLDHFCPSEHTTQLPNVVRCPENEFTYTTGSSSRIECICLAGFKLASTSLVTKCLPCEIGERCQGGLVVEEQCHMQNKVANSDHSACVCHIGFGLYNFECQQCPPGSIKSEIGDFQCTYCGINEYAENVTTCTECPVNSVARPGSTQCFCTAPFVWNGKQCTLCDNNYYRGEVMTSQSGICLKCPVNSSSVASATMNSGITACTCKRGFKKHPENVSNDFLCVSCSQGYYEDDGVCKQCKENAWSPEGSFGEQLCVCNQINSTTCHSKLLDGTCHGECANPPEDCSQCTVGFYKHIYSAVGNEDECLPCAVGTFQSLVGQTSCVNCPQFSTHYELAVTTQDTCKCIPGFTLDLNTSSCQACRKGYYKNFRGDESCLPCQIGTYNPYLNSTICFACSEATNSDLTVTYYRNLEQLYNTQAELESILSANNSVNLVMQSNTTLHPASTSLYDCTCQAGQQAIDLLNDVSLPFLQKCDHCVPGSFKANKGFDACIYCGTIVDEYGAQYKHHYGNENAGATHISHCLACPSFSGQEAHLIGPDGYVMNDITDCKCFRGHENRTLQGCTNCSNYMVQPLFSDNNCVYCDTGYYFVHSTLECQICNLAGSDGSTHTSLVSNILDPTFKWGSSQYDCVCNLGYERLLEDCSPCLPGFFRNDVIRRVCQFCPIDTYQPNHLSTSCNDCPANSQTRGANAQTNIYDCICNAGYEALKMVDDEGVCEQCPAGTYRTNRTREEVLQGCIECPENHFCPTGSVSPIACPSQELSDKGSDELADCECSSGRGRGNGRFNECSDCPPGSFAPSRNNVPCTLCPQNKNTSVGALFLQDCKCIAGHGISGTEDGDEDGDCSSCLNGFFAIGGDNVACLHCGFGTITEPSVGAISFDNCLCDARIGLYETN